MAGPPAYEDQVRQSADRILLEASAFFMQCGSIHQTLRDLARRLDEASIPYAVLGAMALAQHGLVRMTLDIDLLLTPAGLAEFKDRYLNRGYVSAFPGAEKTFRASDTGVRIKVITSGQHPGDRLPKPVSFRHPAEASVELSGLRVIALERLVDLKLASGMTAAHRWRDLADVQDLIRTLRLPSHFADALDASVRPVYQQLWEEAQSPDQLQEG